MGDETFSKAASYVIQHLINIWKDEIMHHLTKSEHDDHIFSYELKNLSDIYQE